MRTVAFCEIEPYCRAVLAKHWPGVPCFGDIRGIDSYELGRLGGVDVICGGFPCQDISFAGAGAGITGERSGLWSEYARVIGLVRPRYVIVENVAALLGRGIGEVLGDLATLGYDAEWHCFPASCVGAPQLRDRAWIVAYPNRDGEHVLAVNAEMASSPTSMAHGASSEAGSQEPSHGGRVAQTPRQDETPQARGRYGGLREYDWHPEPAVCRVVDGLSADVDAVAALGNAVVPQVAEVIGRAIMATVNTEGK